jgi:hypothetical protein
MMGVQQELCNFFKFSPKRQKQLTTTILRAEITETRKTKLDSLSQTRWVERYVVP